MIIYLTNDDFIKSLAKSLNALRPNERMCHLDEFFQNAECFTELDNQLPKRLNFVGHGNLQQQFGSLYAEGLTGYGANEFADQVKKKVSAAGMIYPNLKQELKHINLIGCHLGLIDKNSTSFAHTVAEILSELNELGFKSLQVNAVSNGFGEENASVALPLIHFNALNTFYAYTFANEHRFNYFTNLIDQINLLMRASQYLTKNISRAQEIKSIIEALAEIEEFVLDLTSIGYIDLIQQIYNNSQRYLELQKMYQNLIVDIVSMQQQLENINQVHSENNNTIFLPPSDVFTIERNQRELTFMIQSKKQQLAGIENQLSNIIKIQEQTKSVQHFFLQAFQLIRLFKEEIQKDANVVQTINEIFTYDSNLTHEKFLAKCAALGQVGEFFLATNDIVARLESNPDYNMTFQVQMMKSKEVEMDSLNDEEESSGSELDFNSPSATEMSSEIDEMSPSNSLTSDEESHSEDDAEDNRFYSVQPPVRLLFSTPRKREVVDLTLSNGMSGLKIG